MYKATLKKQGMGKEFAKYAVPAVIGMVVSSLYNIIDGIFVGRGVGETALGAINIVFPFIMLEIAIAMLIAIGGANHMSVSKGRGDYGSANNFFLQSIYLLTSISIIINIVVLMFPIAVCRILGADDALLPYARDYIWWIAVFGIIYMPGLGLSIFIRNDNAPHRELVGTLVGTVVNIVLDYLFIMEFGMGIAGAAIATGIGQAVSLFIFMTHFLQQKRILHFTKVKWNSSDIRKILFSGIPFFLMEFCQSAVAFSFNIALMASVGVVGVSYYSIVMYICSMFNMVLIGLTQGAQPIMSFRYGSDEVAVVKTVRRLAVKTALILTTIIYIVIFFFGRSLASVFVPENGELAGMAANMMRYYFLAFFPISITLMNILYFQVTEQSKQSVLLSFLRCVGFIQLFLLILTPVAGTAGIYVSYLFGELCHYLLSWWLMKKSRKEREFNLPADKIAVAGIK
jgi:putative MATE family efflux protein